MEHVVFYPALDGAPAFRRFGSLEDAVRFVEHLRNAEGVSEVSVHALSPVPLAFRAYFKVEVGPDAPGYDAAPAYEAAPAYDAAGVDASAQDEAPAQVPAQAPAQAEVPAQAQPEPAAAPVEAYAVEPVAEPVLADVVPEAPAASNGKRSLGFFAH